MATEKEYLKAVGLDLQAGGKRRISVRKLLGHFGYARRGSAVITHVRTSLRKQGLTTEPDFATADIDATVKFGLRAGATVPKVPNSVAPNGEPADEPKETPPKPTQFGHVAIKPYNRSFAEAVPESGYRILAKSHEVYEALLKKLQDEDLVTVYGFGQNSFREDRDEFPFYIAIDRRHKGKQIAELEDAYVRALAKSFGGARQEVAEELVPEMTSEIPRVNTASDFRVSLEELERKIIERLEKGLASVRAEVFDVGAETQSSITTQVDRLQHDSVRNLALMQSDEKALNLIDEEHKRHLETLKEKQAIIDGLNEQVIELAAELEEVQPEPQDQDSFDPTDAYATVERTVKLFADLAGGDPILVLESAERSAAQSSSTKRRELLQLLLTLRDLSIHIYTNGNEGKIGPLKDWFKPRGYDYAPQDAEITTEKFGAERTFMWDGQPVQFKEHVTLFSNHKDCIQVYFLRDGAGRRIVIGYVGKHLSTTSRKN